VQQFSRRNNRNIDTIPSHAMDALVNYHWPGNIRELQNVIERGVIVSRGSVLTLPVAEFRSSPARNAVANRAGRPANTLRDTLSTAERAQIVKALEESNWVIAGPKGAAARLGMKRSTLQFRMRKLGIRVARSGS
jgi:formate hydrogenlyase transcriptional activator